MAALKYSKQREAILSYLQSTKQHPTAETVYLQIRKENPKISMGTVYRNLNLLTDMGLAQKIECGDGTDHFDANAEPHNHFICKECGKVLDLELQMDEISHIKSLADDSFAGSIEGFEVYFYGKCEECLAKK